ncbi:hypothetical protein UNSWDHB_1625 [Dehalobacter sp. UNSWDHB]|jgi:peptidoglycan hydrolase CwlO-like protein|uniref:hypothetical protein n=1 Tax=unclassified Dehalobacter TaxID=2635733 RepID=UPI00028AE645|nr:MULTISPECIES: hypothetical protein [unclassified Dehalobacter]AFV03271.1 hypothetical protein DHBDCA_p2244 [Dehalobacter sp. DCA]AFV06257.1 hypothetical protein DCF50_p2254 [Dehalobacter sp. CF]EQB21001.1 hypothetical protein UNSWDHB_1625 [Dehalobacter sp. UNSWDHB]
MDINESILSELQGINKKLEKLDSLEKSVKKIQKDVTNINLHISKGVYVDIERLKSRVTELEKKVM